MLFVLLISCLSNSEQTQSLPATGEQMTNQNSSLFLQEMHQTSAPNNKSCLRQNRHQRLSKALEYLTTATTLDLSNYPNPFTDISILAEFTQIEELYLNDRQVSDLSPLSQFHNLRKLHAEHCERILNPYPISPIWKICCWITLGSTTLNQSNI